MLPPGMLEKLDLVAERLPARSRAGARSRPTAISSTSSSVGPRPVRSIVAPEGKAGLLRRLRALEAARGADAGVDALGGGQRAALRATRRADAGGPRSCGDPRRRGSDPRAGRWGRARSRRSRISRRRVRRRRRSHGSSRGRRRPPRSGHRREPRPARPRRRRGPRASASPARRPTARSPRRATARRAADRSAGGRRRDCPASHRRPRPDAAPPRRRHRRRQDRDLRRGDRRRARGRPAGARPRPRDRPRDADRGPPPGGPRGPRRARPLRAVGRRAGRRVATDPGGRRRHRGGDAARRPRATPRRRARDRRRGARGRVQERPNAAPPGPRRGDPPRASWPGRPSSSAARRPRSTASAAPGTARIVASSCPRDPPASRRRSRSSTCARSSADGNRGLLSGRLAAALAALDRDAGEQAILVINRRGTASVVLCRDCGHVQACPDCERPLVFHQAGDDAPLPPLRPRLAARVALPGLQLGPDPVPRRRHGARRTRGPRPLPGLARRPPRSRHRRAPRRSGAGPRRASPRASVDVLVGTSLVAKGLDVPNVTLVGVVSADVSLNLPDERAAERTYQLLAQAVGRAGRGDRRGSAIIQSYQPDHPAILAVANDDAAAFYDAELELRRRFGSPPFGRLVKLTCARRGPRRGREDRAGDGRRRCATGRVQRGSDVTIAGPAPAYIARRADRWRWNVVLRGRDPVASPRRRPRRPVVGRRRPGVAAVTAEPGRRGRERPSSCGASEPAGSVASGSRACPSASCSPSPRSSSSWASP